MTSRTVLVVVALLVLGTVVPGVAAATGSYSNSAALDGATVAAHGGQSQECSFPFSSTDATGTEVTVEQKPERVVTLGPSAAQTMWEIGGKGQVVGVTKYGAYLDGAETRANVSGTGQVAVNVEKVVGLDPDLVLVPNVDTISNDTIEQLRSAGITVYKFDRATSIDFVVEKTTLFGKLTGNCGGAERSASELQSQVTEVRQTVKGEDRPRVLYVFFGYTAGEKTFIDTIIEAAGGTNVAAEAGIEGYQPISDETVVEQNPEWIVLNSDDTQGVPKKEAYTSTVAVQQDNVVTLNANYISQPAPRIVEPVTKLAHALHPEAFESADATATGTATAGAATTAADEGTTTGGGHGDSGGVIPGFGVVAAVVALVAAALLARRP